jgi:hypothetical protein
MKPTPLEWLIASRYTLLLWIGLALYFWVSHGSDWNSFTNDQQLAIIIVCGLFAVLWMKAIPTVFFYEREQALYRKSHISPEERWRRATIRQTFFLALVAAALVYMGWQWWKAPAAEPQPASIKAAVGIGGFSLVATTAYLTSKSLLVWKLPSKKDQPFYVSCCLPIPQTTETEMELPDYCKQLLAGGEMPAPAQTAGPEQEVKT